MLQSELDLRGLRILIVTLNSSVTQPPNIFLKLTNNNNNKPPHDYKAIFMIAGCLMLQSILCVGQLQSACCIQKGFLAIFFLFAA